MKYEKGQNGQVMRVEEVETKVQTAIVKTYYDQEYHIRLEQLVGKIKANVYNYLNEPQPDWQGTITFKLDGETVDVETITGEATIEFETEVPGAYKIIANADYLRGDQVEVVAE